MASKQPPPNKRMQRIQARLRASMFSGRAAAAAAPAPASAAPRPTCKAVRRGYGRYPNLARIHPEGCKLRRTVSIMPPMNMMGLGGGYRTVRTNKRGQIKRKLYTKNDRAIFDVTLPAPAGSAGVGITHEFIWSTSAGREADLQCGLIRARSWGLLRPNGGGLNDFTSKYSSVATTIPSINKPARLFKNVTVEVLHDDLPPGSVYTIICSIQVSANAYPLIGVGAIGQIA